MKKKHEKRMLNNFLITNSQQYFVPAYWLTQIDEQYHKVIGDELRDWVHWDLPVKPYVPQHLVDAVKYFFKKLIN